jgi:hypothetical protein
MPRVDVASNPLHRFNGKGHEGHVALNPGTMLHPGAGPTVIVSFDTACKSLYTREPSNP